MSQNIIISIEKLTINKWSVCTC